MTLDERIDRTRLLVFKIFVRTCVACGAYKFLARFCMRYVSEFVDIKHRPNSIDQADVITVLVLDVDRFRGDLELFAQESHDIRILNISWNLLRHLLASYVYNPTIYEEINHHETLGIRWEFAAAKPGSRIYSQRDQYRKFLRKFLVHFLPMLGVDLIMNSDHRYRREADFSRVACELGYPHICYYREALYIAPSHYKLAVERHGVFKPFRGSVIAVQNSVTRQMFIDSGMAGSEKIFVRGCPRMDKLVARVADQKITPRKKDGIYQIVYFSSPRAAQLVKGGHSKSALVPGDIYSFDLFSSAKMTVRALAELAQSNDNIRVILKMKDLHIKGRDRGQMKVFQDIISDVSGSSDGLINMIFETGRMSAQDVILNSDIVCGMQSTSILEAAIIGKPIMLPHFKEMREAKGANEALMYQENYDLFDVPNDVAELKEMIKRRLVDATISPEIMKKRRALFEEHVSPLAGGATDMSLNLIREFAKTKKLSGRATSTAVGLVSED